MIGYLNAAQCTILQGGGEAPFRPSGRTHLLFDVLAQDGDAPVDYAHNLTYINGSADW